MATEMATAAATAAGRMNEDVFVGDDVDDDGKGNDAMDDDDNDSDGNGDSDGDGAMDDDGITTRCVIYHQHCLLSDCRLLRNDHWR